MRIYVKFRVFLLLIIISTFKLEATDSGNNPFMRVISVLEEALQEKSMDKLSACISPEFSVSVANLPSAQRYMMPIFDQLSSVDSIRLIDDVISTTEKGDSCIQTKFYFSENASELSGICFDKNYKIKYVDYFDRLYGMHRDRPSTLITKVPFEYINDAIIVSLKINEYDKTLRFLFDTGADGMAITKQLADEIGLTTDRQNEASIVGTSRNISISSNNTVHLDTLSITRQNIAIFEDMGEYDGILGLTLAYDFIVEVDFDASVLFLYSLGDYNPRSNSSTIPISVPSGIIHIPSKLNLLGKKEIDANFVLDTGAGYHLVAFNPFVRKNRLLLSGFKYDSQSSMVSMGHSTQVYHGKASNFSFANIDISDMPITLQASPGNDNWEPGAAGSIGIKLLKDYNFTINLVEKEIYLEKRNLK